MTTSRSKTKKKTMAHDGRKCERQMRMLMSRRRVSEGERSHRVKKYANVNSDSEQKTACTTVEVIHLSHTALQMDGKRVYAM